MEQIPAFLLAIDAAESKRLRELPYLEFLDTPYWRAVSRLVKARCGNLCQKCGRPGGKYRQLEVHHLSYKHHGKESKHLSDLICLCRECHRKLHQDKRVTYPRLYKRRREHTSKAEIQRTRPRKGRPSHKRNPKNTA